MLTKGWTGWKRRSHGAAIGLVSSKAHLMLITEPRYADLAPTISLPLDPLDTKILSLAATAIFKF